MVQIFLLDARLLLFQKKIKKAFLWNFVASKIVTIFVLHISGHSSVGLERYLDRVEVAGSNPAVSTEKIEVKQEHKIARFCAFVFYIPLINSIC